MRALVVAGLAFGDEGKGAVTDYLVRKHKSPLVVRYNGGPQAAHNVVTPDGVHHTFAQFGAGTLAGARTFLSRFMLIEPFAMLKEAAVLETKVKFNVWERLTVDPKCVIITPYHVMANRERERRRNDKRHGSVGLGVGEARGDELSGLALRVEDIDDPDEAVVILREIMTKKMLDLGISPAGMIPPEVYVERYLEEWSPHIRRRDAWRDIDIDDVVVFEGAQGVLLDETHGFAPHNSWTNCTFENAATVLREARLGNCDVTNIGVVRSYYTRHGAGPFPTYDSRVAFNEERHNKSHPFMGEFRTGHFDGVLFNYACSVARPHELIVTHMDIVSTPTACVSYSNYDGDCFTSITHVAPEHRTKFLNSVRPDYVRFNGPHRFIDWLQLRSSAQVTHVLRGAAANCMEKLETREVEA